MKRSILIVFFASLTLNLFAQKETNWWYFGNSAGMSFTGTGGTPVVQTNGKMNNAEGVASISNSKGGLLFYTDGEQVFNKSHNVMINGGSGGTDVRLKGHNSSTQSAVIVQQPVRSYRYYIFTVDEEWKSNGFQYSIVDTSLNGGQGQVIQKNVQLLSNSAEKVAAVKHANKVDTWVVTHTPSNNNFYVYKLSSQGIGSPVVSSVGPTWDGANRGYSKGYMKFTPDGTKLIAAIAGFQGYSGNNGRIEIYDFDNLTGTISNPKVIDKTNIKSGVGNISSVYGVEISPNGRYLYISFYLPAYSFGGDGNDGIWQLDLLAGNANAIGASCVKVLNSTNPNPGGGMQLGPDGKIYVARYNATYLSCIQKPNCQGTACSFVDNAISLSGKRSQWGVPTFINSFLNKAEFEWGSNAANLCENSLTKLFVTDSTGIDSATWNFGDPSTGKYNTARGFTVYHKFSTPKSYSVFVQLYRKVASPDCYADTARKLLTIFKNPVFTLGADTVICQGEEVTKVVSVTNATYIWNDGSTVPAYIAKTKGWHWLAAKVGGCTTTDSLYVDVIQYPKFSLGNDTLICLGDSVKFTASNGKRYLWSLGDTTATAYAKKAGSIWARASNGTCHTYDTVKLSTRSLPVLNLGKDTLLCKGDSITLNAQTADSKFYLWSTLTTNPTLKVKTSGIYWALIKDTMCFSKPDSIDVAFQTKASFSLGKDTSFCVGNSFTLNAALSGAKTWKWKDNSTKSTLVVTTAGKQWVTVSNGTCQFFDTIDFVTYSIPAFKLGNDTILCQGATYNPISTILNNVEYTWMGSTVSTSYPITKTGKYYVDLRDLPKKVCKTSDTILVTFNKPLKFSLGNDTILCVGQFANITIANLTLKSFSWWDANTTNKTRQNTTPPGGIHWVDVNDGVCVSRDSIKITYRPELFIPELGQDFILCDIEDTAFDITAGNVTAYSWKTPSGTQLATVPKYTVNTPGGMFIGIITDGYCTKRDSITVSYKVTPPVNLGMDLEVCDGVSPTLDASASAAETYLWNTGASTATISAANLPKTKYWVRASNGLCDNSDTVWVSFAIPPQLDFGFDDSVFCNAPVLNYDFSFYKENTTFRWQDGSTLPTRKIKIPGLYWVVAENFCGEDSVSVNIRIDELGCRIYFPTVFSPNGDGINDVWKPRGQVIEWVELVVYNRWGEIIHRGKPNDGWDGYFKNEYVPDGIYPITVAYRQDNAGYPRLFIKNMVLTVTK